MTTDITLALPQEEAARLRKEFDQFIGVSTGLDREFLPPEFHDFLRARLLQHDGPLTERAVSRLLSGGEYGWARRVFDKQLPNALAALMRDAQRFGFGLAVQPGWSGEQRLAHAREWAAQVLAECGADSAYTEALATQVAASAEDLRALEERMRTPAWRLAESLRQRAYDLMYALQTEDNEAAGRARVGELRGMLGLALEYGSVQPEEASRVLEQVERVRPALFREAPDDVFARLANWLRRLFGH
ncbi:MULTISPECIES: DUF4088 family protein [Cupriavidus]|uniref:DUF4088 family protein n=1 Tax=Cupriavidus TaxID=106589 RepID=UPI000E10C7F7|nr:MULTISPECIES: DUF4088 family protein [Cupriavidus]MCO4891352.1 DUF4088 domain-containing protein [Cupriavidus sp. WGtm5]MEC3767519.1 DUF4088 family protein [Cupriavidus sp. SS-3]SPA34035.1 conserved hypothetical protein [Cupriavidus taiwanensis]SPA40620.1 conserved hypothetical protein [Cupriavidus taiwanensis]SPA41549.1 conserved hypothetical protein [Cupriavidus taiwanensis]